MKNLTVTNFIENQLYTYRYLRDEMVIFSVDTENHLKYVLMIGEFGGFNNYTHEMMFNETQDLNIKNTELEVTSYHKGLIFKSPFELDRVQIYTERPYKYFSKEYIEFTDERFDILIDDEGV